MTKALTNTRLTILSLMAVALPSLSRGQVPVFEINVPESKIRFEVNASVKLVGTFEKWDATLRFSSPEIETGVLDIKIQAASVNAGSRMKEDTLRDKDFFDVKNDPLITFLSKKIVAVGPDKYRVEGDFTIRGVSKPEVLTLTVVREGNGVGRIEGQMAFDRREFGMTHNIPFIRIADRVEVDVDLSVHRISGPPVTEKEVRAADSGYK